jgi:hypothetical protein
MREHRASLRLGSFLKHHNYTSRLAGSVEQLMEHIPRFPRRRRKQKIFCPATMPPRTSGKAVTAMTFMM